MAVVATKFFFKAAFLGSLLLLASGMVAANGAAVVQDFFFAPLKQPIVAACSIDDPCIPPQCLNLNRIGCIVLTMIVFGSS